MPAVVFTLERFNWRHSAVGWLVLPGADRQETYVDRVEAEAALREREWALRRRINPFRCGGPFIHYQTGFDAARLHDWFLDAGLDPPGATADSAVWAAVWDRDHAAMSDAQRAAAWEALDRVRFFQITAGPPARPMRLVAEPHHEEDPITPPYGTFAHVGGTPYMLVRRPETADALCQALFVDSVVRSGGYIGASAAPQTWAVETHDPFDPRPPEPELWATAEYAEHRPLGLVSDREPTPGQTMYVVLRRHWRLELPDDAPWRWCLTSARPCGHAVAAFDTLAAADVHVSGLEAQARTYPSPFRFGTPLEWGTLHASGVWGVLSGMAEIDFTSLWSDYRAPDPVWSRWWDDNLPAFTPEQVALVWSLFERLRFYDVTEVEYRD